MNSFRSENTDNLNLKVVVIFATKNEENTIENSVFIAKKSYYKPKVLVVDAYSSDKTTELAITAGAVVTQQSKHLFPGKGLAMNEGLEEAIERMSADIIVFLDADIRNLTTDWVNQLVGAISDDNCDMSKRIL